MKIIFFLLMSFSIALSAIEPFTFSKGTGKLKINSDSIELIPEDLDNTDISAFSGFKELNSEQWSVDAVVGFNSNYLMQYGGIAIGDGKQMIKLAVGKLVLNGSKFNIGLFNGKKLKNKSLLPGYEGGNKIHLRLFKTNNIIYSSYSLDGQNYTICGSIKAANIKVTRAGIYFSDFNMKNRLKRIPAGCAANGEFKCYSFTVKPDIAPDALKTFGRVFMKLKVIASAPKAVKAAVTLYAESHIKLRQFGIGATKGIVPMTPRFHGRQAWKLLGKNDAFMPGAQSPWCDVSDIFAVPHQGLTMVLAFQNGNKHLFMGSDSGNIRGFDVELSFADAPDDESIIKTIRYSSRHHSLVLLLPPNSGTLKQWGPDIRTVYDYAKSRLAAAKKAGAKPFKPASLIPIGGIGLKKGVHSHWYDQQTLEIEHRIAKMLGNNHETVPETQLPALKKFDFWSPKLEKDFRNMLLKRRYSVPAGSFCVKIGDEPNLISIDRLKASAEGMKKFHRFLLARGETAQSLGVKNINQVMPIKRSEVQSLKQRRLFYHQVFFLQQSTWELYRIFGRAFKRIYPRAELTTDVHFGGFANNPDYFVESRMGANDWQKHHYGSGETLTRQIFGNFFLADTLRSAAKFGKIKPGMLWFICRLAGKRGVRLTGISALIRNLQHVYLYGYGPAAFRTEWFSDDKYKTDAFAAASEMLHAWSRFERYLVHGKTAETQAAILLSRGNAIWEGLNISDNTVAFAHSDARESASNSVVKKQYASGSAVERAMLIGTLGLNGIRCDVLPTEEINRLDNYRVLYIYEPVVEKEAGKKIIEWVKNGGVLYLGAEAGTFDEFKRPLDLLKSAIGPKAVRTTVSGETARFPVYGGYGEIWTFSSTYFEEDAPVLKVLDYVTCGKAKAKVLGLKQNLKIPTMKVLARYSSGAPAMGVMELGKGKIVVSGMRLGIVLAATAKPGFHERTDFKLPPFTLRNTGASAYWRRTFTPQFEQLVLAPTKIAGITAPVKLPFSGIDSGYYELPDKSGALVLLGNYTTKNTSKLSIELALKGDYSKAKTFSGKPVSLKRSGNIYQLQISLDDYEIIEVKK